MRKKTTPKKKAKTKLYPWMEKDLEFVRKCGGEASGKPELIERTKKFVKQYEEKGWCSAECWSLDHRFAQWIVPRLKHFIEFCPGTPGVIGKDEWKMILNTMLEGFELMASDGYWTLKQNEQDKVTRSLQLFGEYAQCLWY
jgi:hypothetical protein